MYINTLLYVLSTICTIIGIYTIVNSRNTKNFDRNLSILLPSQSPQNSILLELSMKNEYYNKASNLFLAGIINLAIGLSLFMILSYKRFYSDKISENYFGNICIIIFIFFLVIGMYVVTKNTF